MTVAELLAARVCYGRYAAITKAQSVHCNSIIANPLKYNQPSISIDDNHFPTLRPDHTHIEPR